MSSSKTNTLFLGRIISPNPDQISILNGYLSVEYGKITSKGNMQQYENYKRNINISDFEIITMSESQFLMPGLIDCHVHAPQFPNLGIGLDRPLLEWLAKYTYPLEKKYSDIEFASKVYNTVVSRLIKNGTTTACYFGSLDLEGTLQLAKSVVRYGQRALIGKVSMNVANDARYYNSTDREIKDTESFINAVCDLKNDLVEPVITPRFALSCDEELMRQLGALAVKYNCRIQTHISENKNEVQTVLDVFKYAKCYTDVYNKYGLLTDKTVLAHAIYLSEEEMRSVAQRGAAIAHCPASNTRLKSGLCPLRRLLEYGIPIGLGTDVSGGDSASVVDAARRCLDVSTHRELLGERNAALAWWEALHLATLGGAQALGLADKIGDFTIGKQLDALLVDVFCKSGPMDSYDFEGGETEREFTENLVQRFLYVGDDRNVLKVFVNGVEIKQNLEYIGTDPAVDALKSKSECLLL